MKERQREKGTSRGKRGITIRYTQSQSVASSMGSFCWSAMCKALGSLAPSLSRQTSHPGRHKPGGRCVSATPGSSQWRDQSRDRRMGPLSLCSRVSQNKRILLSDGSRMEVVRPEEQMVQGTATERHLHSAKGSVAFNASACLVSG